MFGSFLPSSPLLPYLIPPSPPGRNCSALISNFVEERVYKKILITELEEDRLINKFLLACFKRWCTGQTLDINSGKHQSTKIGVAKSR
jgi:hypothetical protein